MNQDSAKLIAAVTPATPVWAVYYNPNSDEIFTQPILCLNVWQIDDGEERMSDVRPVAFNPEYPDEECGSCETYLGLSLTASPDRAEWQGLIDGRRKRGRFKAYGQSG